MALRTNMYIAEFYSIAYLNAFKHYFLLGKIWFTRDCKPELSMVQMRRGKMLLSASISYAEVISN